MHFNPTVQLKTQYGRALFYDFVDQRESHAERQQR